MPIPVRQRREAVANPSLAPKPAPAAPRPAKPKPTPKPPKPAKPPQKPPKVKTPPPPPRPRPEFVCGHEPLDMLAIKRRRLQGGKGKVPTDLPAIPIDRADFPTEMPVLRGVIFSRLGCTRRPFVFVRVHCPHCQKPLTVPWRADWPIAKNVVSIQFTTCDDGTKRTLLIGLSTSQEAANIKTIEEAKALFGPWKEGFDKIREEKKAAKKARKLAAKTEEAAK